jgi:hypothetical protein
MKKTTYPSGCDFWHGYNNYLSKKKSWTVSLKVFIFHKNSYLKKLSIFVRVKSSQSPYYWIKTLNSRTSNWRPTLWRNTEIPSTGNVLCNNILSTENEKARWFTHTHKESQSLKYLYITTLYQLDSRLCNSELEKYFHNLRITSLEWFGNKWIWPFILILSSSLCMHMPNDLFSRGFPTNT